MSRRRRTLGLTAVNSGWKWEEDGSSCCEGGGKGAGGGSPGSHTCPLPVVRCWTGFTCISAPSARRRVPWWMGPFLPGATASSQQGFLAAILKTWKKKSILFLEMPTVFIVVTLSDSVSNECEGTVKILQLCWHLASNVASLRKFRKLSFSWNSWVLLFHLNVTYKIIYQRLLNIKLLPCSFCSFLILKQEKGFILFLNRIFKICYF